MRQPRVHVARRYDGPAVLIDDTGARTDAMVALRVERLQIPSGDPDLLPWDLGESWCGTLRRPLPAPPDGPYRLELPSGTGDVTLEQRAPTVVVLNGSGPPPL
jgi:hypothetical protein